MSLARLAGNQDAYFGKELTTSGLVEVETDANGSHYFVLADSAQNLVLLVPEDRAHPFAGRDVIVRGRFGFSPHLGRLLRIVSVTVAGEK